GKKSGELRKQNEATTKQNEAKRSNNEAKRSNNEANFLDNKDFSQELNKNNSIATKQTKQNEAVLEANEPNESKVNEIKRNNNIDISILNEEKEKSGEHVDNSKLSERDKGTVQRLVENVGGMENDFNCFCAIAYQLGISALERFVGLARESDAKNKPAYVMGIAKNEGYKIL
ncbi:MAG: hypothetical protein KKH44_08750, partial [Bacteroidetes bacterium]|nr:hypothetical protein [Bacteroidota bacterium]